MTSLDQSGKWVFISPVGGIRFADDSRRELNIDGVCIVRADKLQRIRKRLKIDQCLSESHYFNDIRREDKSTDVFAVWVTGGIGRKRKEEFHKKVEKVLNVISLLQILSPSRVLNINPSIGQHNYKGGEQTISLNSKAKYEQLGFNRKGKDLEIVYDKQLQVKERFFFRKLIDVIEGNTGIKNEWRNCITNAAEFAGESQGLNDTSHAFLWNFIAIETLLTKGGSKHSEGMQNIIESLFFWIDEELDGFSFPSKIKEAYVKRNDFVHDGKKESITLDDVIFTDMLLMNLFYIILNNQCTFSNKDALYAHAEKYRARKLLGLNLDGFKKYGFLGYADQGVTCVHYRELNRIG